MTASHLFESNRVLKLDLPTEQEKVLKQLLDVINEYCELNEPSKLEVMGIVSFFKAVMDTQLQEGITLEDLVQLGIVETYSSH